MRTEVPIVVQDAAGNALAGASVMLNVRGGGAAAVYAGESGATTLTLPLVSDAAGRVSGWVDRGAYDATVSAAGMATYHEYFDSAPASDGAVDAGWLGDLSVGTAKLANNAVTAAKVADGVLPASKFISGVVGNVPVVTTAAALAALTPFDGMEIYFQPDAANGIMWKLRYNAGSASAFKWEWVGGSDVASATSNNSAITATVDTADIAFYTVPLAGDYDIMFRAHADGPTTTDSQFTVGVGTTAIQGDVINWRSQSGNGGWIEGFAKARVTGLAAGNVLNWRHWTTLGTWRVFGRRAWIHPVRVG